MQIRHNDKTKAACQKGVKLIPFVATNPTPEIVSHPLMKSYKNNASYKDE